MEACYSAISKDWVVRCLIDLSIESFAAPRKHLVDNWPATCKWWPKATRQIIDEPLYMQYFSWQARISPTLFFHKLLVLRTILLLAEKFQFRRIRALFATGGFSRSHRRVEILYWRLLARKEISALLNVICFAWPAYEQIILVVLSWNGNWFVCLGWHLSSMAHVEFGHIGWDQDRGLRGCWVGLICW